MNAKPAVVFIRHAEAEGQAKVVKGNRDYPLDAKGKKQSIQIAKRITSRFHPQVVLSSPLERASHVARAIGKKAQAPVKIQKNLQPPNFGSYTGKPLATHQPKIAAHFKNSPNKPFPGGGDRPNQWLSENASAIRNAQRLSNSKGTVAVVTHSRNLRELSHSLKGTPPADPTKGGPQPGGYVTLSKSGKLSKPRNLNA